MDFRCEVKNCCKSSILGDLFMSPQEPNLLKQWQKTIGTNKSDFFVCERHFNKEEIIFEKNLKDTAVPKLHLTGESFKLENNCCGLCLNDLDEPHEISRESRDYFIEISGCEVSERSSLKNTLISLHFKPLTDLMCRECKFTLISLKKFQTDLPEKHTNIRNAVSAQLIEDDPLPKKNYFFCSYCTKFQTNEEKWLKEHIKEKHSFQCDDCRFFCSRAKELETHIIHGHKTRENHQCSICGLKGFLNTAMLNLHKEQLHRVKKFPCRFCQQEFGNAVDLRVHVAYLHPFSKRAVFKKQANVVVPKPLTHLAIRKIVPKSILQVQREKQKAVKKVSPVSHDLKKDDPWKLITVKFEPNNDEVEIVQQEMAVVKEEPELMIRGDVDNMFEERMPEIKEQSIKLEIVSLAEERIDPISYWDRNSNTTPFDTVKCLDCNKTMCIEDLLGKEYFYFC